MNTISFKWNDGIQLVKGSLKNADGIQLFAGFPHSSKVYLPWYNPNFHDGVWKKKNPISQWERDDTWRQANTRELISATNPTWRRRDVIVLAFVLSLLYRPRINGNGLTTLTEAWEEYPGIMLRSTGFFRGLDCPFYIEDTEGKGSGNGCNRPYCHFRHSQQRRQTYAGATVETKKLDASQKGDFQCGT